MKTANPINEVSRSTLKSNYTPFFSSIYENEPESHIDLCEIINDIQTGAYKPQIERIRSGKDK